MNVLCETHYIHVRRFSMMPIDDQHVHGPCCLQTSPFTICHHMSNCLTISTFHNGSQVNVSCYVGIDMVFTIVLQHTYICKAVCHKIIRLIIWLCIQKHTCFSIEVVIAWQQSSETLSTIPGSAGHIVPELGGFYLPFRGQTI